MRSPVRACLVLPLLAAAAFAQPKLDPAPVTAPPVAPASTPPPPAAPAGQPARTGKPGDGAIGAAVALRERVEAMRLRRRVLPLVAIVRDAKAYCAAINDWTPETYFPVLIDDGSLAAREDIARFVRAFRPERVVRYTAPSSFFWPETADDRRDRLPHIVAKTLGIPDGAWLRERAKTGEFKPAGIVVTSMDDAAWPAGLALAAGRGQLLAFAPKQFSGGVDGTTNITATDQLRAVATGFCHTAGISYDRLGDTIDALTLCLNTPSRLKIDSPQDLPGTPPLAAKPGEYLAMTDVIGRGNDHQTRWAWVGQIFGNNAAAAYRAMCGLFLQPTSLWGFDGYEPGEPWSMFSLKKAAEPLERAGWATWVNPPGKQGENDFRFGAAMVTPASKGHNAYAGVDAGLVLVNTMGNADFFQLRPGTCYPGDLPLFNVPPVVSFVHSWSLQTPGTRTTIGGRLLEHGAYAVVGSMHEPYLAAFVPTPMFVQRMTVMPLGAAMRHDAGVAAAPWRITLLGDPLITFGPPAPRGALPGAGDNTGPLEDELRDALRDKKFEEGLRALVMLGRDRDAVRLARALLEQNAEDLTPGAALAAVLPAYRCAEFDLCAKLALRAGELATQHTVVQDALWHAVRGTSGASTRDQVLALKLAVREGTFARDAKEAAERLDAVVGNGAGRGFLRAMREKAGKDQKAQIDALLKSGQ